MKARSIARSILFSSTLAALAGCASSSSTFDLPHSLGQGETILTTADLRAMVTTPVDHDAWGRISPRQLTCIEPSPDLAKALSSDVSAGTSFSVVQPTGPSLDAALALATARAESAAQMTDRLAVIQLLRDALYRACEAYANGALTRTSYAVLLSRYDDVMITMLLGELAAGNFGGTLATLGGSASGDANAALVNKAIDNQVDAEEAKSSAEGAQGEKASIDDQVKQQESVVKQKEVNLKQKSDAEKAARKTPPGDDGTATDLATKQSELRTAEDELAEEKKTLEDLKVRQLAADKALETALRTAATSRARAQASAAGGAVRAKETSEVASQLAQMQRKYMENINADALVVACVSALDTQQSQATWLAKICNDVLLPGLLQSMVGTVAVLKNRRYDENMTQTVLFQRARIEELKRLLNATDIAAELSIEKDE